MRILLHDWARYQFIEELGRQLAAEGDIVAHRYFGEFQGPNVNTGGRTAAPSGFDTASLELGRAYPKYTLIRRTLADRAYGDRLAQEIRTLRPDVVLCANTPAPSIAEAIRATHAIGAAFVLWVQDVYHLAVEHALRARLPGRAARGVAGYFRAAERSAVRNADGVIFITPDFEDVLGHAAHSIVQPNWASPESTRPAPRTNPWALRNGLHERPVVMYAGTLGVKHDSAHLLRLAEALTGKADVVVVSEGRGADELRAHQARLSALRVLPFQPAAELADMLATADVLVAILDEGASSFSVPSKILTYMCAGRPIVAAMPSGNAAASLLRDAGAGIVVQAEEREEFVAAVIDLLGDTERRTRMGAAARNFAEANFDLPKITSNIHRFLSSAVTRRAIASPAA